MTTMVGSREPTTPITLGLAAPRAAVEATGTRAGGRGGGALVGTPTARYLVNSSRGKEPRDGAKQVGLGAASLGQGCGSLAVTQRLCVAVNVARKP